MNRSRIAGLVVVGFGAAAVALVSPALRSAPAEHGVRHIVARWNGATFVEVGDGVFQRRGNDCGPAALAHALRLLGVPAPYPDTSSTIELGRRGCRFGDLHRECGRYGVAAEFRRTDVLGLERTRPPAVLFLSRGHFVVFEGSEGGVIRVHDPSIGRIEYRADSFHRRWRGELMWFPRDSERARDGCEAAPQNGGRT